MLTFDALGFDLACGYCIGLKSKSFLLVSLALTISAPAHARLFRHPNRPDCNPASITARDIRGFHQVDRGLYRGGHPTCEGYAKLRAIGIRTIIDLQGELERKIEHCEANAGGDKSQYRFIPFDIHLIQTVLTGVPDSQLRNLFTLIAQAPKPIFINCKFGEDRTGLVVAIYRMKRGEMDYQQARREALYYGFETHLFGLNKTMKRYLDPQRLAALPRPDLSSRPPASACRPKDHGE